ncbi:Cf-4/9 disease resistance family protein [Salix suchowensis]|nr:Cf-4/9 disease resistance family protein [Salix suchowensis]
MSSSVRFVTVRMFSLLLLMFFHLRACHSSPSMHPLCHDEESHALLQFKQSLAINESASLDPSAYPKVASWKVDGESRDCCSWDGVECDRDSGHVIGLDLNSSFLYGSIDSNSSLFHLVHLRRLNLADNDFNNSEIPSEIRNLPRLFDLNLSFSVFSGQIPAEILELSKLVSIDLGLNSLKLQKPGLQHLVEALTNLEVLHLRGVDISAKVPQIMANLSSLSSLFLRDCGLQGEFPLGIFQVPNLRSLSIQFNPYLTGYLPEFQSGSQLELLLLEGTSFSGQLPESIGNLKLLKEFDVAECNFSGAIPSSLEYLGLSYNFFNETLDLNLLLKFRNLVTLQLSGNNLSLPNSQNATFAQPKLKILLLNGCNLGTFPIFLCYQNNLELLHLDDNKLEGHIPKWFMNMSTITLESLSLAGNFLTGFEQSFEVLPWNKLQSLNLHSNKFHGSLPTPPPAIFEYDVSNNKFTGEIPKVFCNLASLSVLELSNNNLSGKLPPCLGNKSSTISVLNLGDNSFSGDIPETFTSGCSLRVINFSQNKLEGKIPRSLANCTKLEILNLEQNKINDVFPSWLGILPDLRVLILRSNRLHGVIGKPKNNVEFPRVQIVVLSNNNFKGNLPLEYFRNWTAMKNVHSDHFLHYMQVNTSFQHNYEYYSMKMTYYYEYYSMTMTNKGVTIFYEKIQDSFTAIDLSCNDFEGGIPVVLGDLKALHSLNLSNNFLSGGIPPSLSNLTKLESLDLSQNKLSGNIPVQLAQLNFLEVLNVSHNFLSGPIPQGNQFDTFDNTSFDANSGLCGKPLSGKCRDGEDSLPAPKEDEGSESPLEFGWKAVAIGYAVGLVIGVIIGSIMNTREYEWLVNNYFVRL